MLNRVGTCRYAFPRRSLCLSFPPGCQALSLHRSLKTWKTQFDPAVIKRPTAKSTAKSTAKPIAKLPTIRSQVWRGNPELPHLRTLKQNEVIIVRSKDGKRNIGCAVYGAPLEKAEKVIFYFHGTPGCRLDAAWTDTYFKDWNRKWTIIAIDRPGYGRSDLVKDASLECLVEDVRSVADHFGVDKFYNYGISGGGPLAFAVARFMPERVILTVADCPVTPPEVGRAYVTDDWFREALQVNLLYRRGFRSLYRLFFRGECQRVKARIEETNIRAQHKDLELWYGLAQQSTIHFQQSEEEKKQSKKSLQSVEALQKTMTLKSEIFRQGDVGYLEDQIRHKRPWGFKLETIDKDTASRIIIMTGYKDVNTPHRAVREAVKEIGCILLTPGEGTHYTPHGRSLWLMQCLDDEWKSLEYWEGHKRRGTLASKFPPDCVVKGPSKGLRGR